MANIIIQGQAPRSFDHPTSRDVWVVGGPVLPDRWDRLYELHGLEWLKQKRNKAYMDFLKTIVAPQQLIMPPLPVPLPNATDFKIKKLVQDTPTPSHLPYLTSDVAAVLAWAIHQGVESITLDGFTWNGGDPDWVRPEWEKACIEYWIGRAETTVPQIPVFFPIDCGLFARSGWMSGFEGAGSMG